MTPWHAQYWHDVIAWGQQAKAMYSGQDAVPVALLQAQPDGLAAEPVDINEDTRSN
jgi:hypothetical protein